MKVTEHHPWIWWATVEQHFLLFSKTLIFLLPVWGTARSAPLCDRVWHPPRRPHLSSSMCSCWGLVDLCWKNWKVTITHISRTFHLNYTLVSFASQQQCISTSVKVLQWHCGPVREQLATLWRRGTFPSVWADVGVALPFPAVSTLDNECDRAQGLLNDKRLIRQHRVLPLCAPTSAAFPAHVSQGVSRLFKDN